MEDKGKSVDNRTSQDIDLHVDELEKEVKRLLLVKGQIHEEYNNLQRQLITIEQQKLAVKHDKHTIKERLDKAHVVINDLELEIRLERRRFWLAKNAGA